MISHASGAYCPHMNGGGPWRNRRRSEAAPPRARKWKSCYGCCAVKIWIWQQTKGFANTHSETGVEVSRQLERVKHLLWHGHVDEALERLTDLLMDLDLIGHHSVSAEKLAVGVAEFETHIRNKQASIPHYGERYRQGDTISTGFVESTIN